jgi:hypothetical protein
MEIREDSNLWSTSNNNSTLNTNNNNNNNGNSSNNNNHNNDSSYSINKHVTLLLFRDGDHLNLLRVIDRGDINSPISGVMR